MGNPRRRHKYAGWLFIGTIVGWASTHVLMILLDPPENSWVFHILLAISWGALTLTAMDIRATTDVRKEQE